MARSGGVGLSAEMHFRSHPNGWVRTGTALVVLARRQPTHPRDVALGVRVGLRGWMRMNPARPPRPRYSEVVKRVFGAQRAGRGPPRIGIVPFVPGWRPTDEATRPGLGSSDQAALLL